MRKFCFPRLYISLALVVASNIGVAAGAFAADQRIVVAQAAEKYEKVSGQADGVVKAVDLEERRIRIEHGPISGSLQMMGMTMAFKVAPGVDMSALAPGVKIRFTVARDAKGLFLIEKIEPAK